MKRRDFLSWTTTATAGAATAALAGCGAQTPNSASSSNQAPPTQTFNWSLALGIPKALPLWGSAIETFAKNVYTMSGGRLVIKVYGIGDRHKSLGQVFDGVKDGRYEMGHAAAYYWVGKGEDMKAAAFFTTVPFGMNAAGMSSWLNAGGGQALYDELYAPHGLKALPCGNTGVQAGGWFRKPITSIADFKGLRMRIPGFGGEVLKRVGGSPQLLAGGEIFQALDQGRIDATEWVGPYHDYLQKFHQAAKYYYTGGWHEPGATLELLINKKAWEGLPADLQAIVTACAAQTDRDMYADWTAKDAEYFTKIKNMSDVTIGNFPKEVTDALQVAADEFLNEIKASSPLAAKIYDSYMSFKNQYQAYYIANELAYTTTWS